jgi:hypothetical protein
MNYKEQYQKFRDEINALDVQSSILQDKIYALSQKQFDIIVSLIQEDKLLQGAPWKLVASSGDRIWLQYSIATVHGNCPHSRLKDILGTEPPYAFDIEPNTELRFEDSHVSIHFDNNDMIKPFIKKYGLVIDGSGIGGKLQGIRHQLNQLEKIIHQFGIKE